MKKTFQLVHAKIKYPRMIESVKNEIRKYLKRNRKKTLPENTDYWDFACKFGEKEESAQKIHLSEIDKCINESEQKQLESFYVEIIPVASVRKKA